MAEERQATPSMSCFDLEGVDGNAKDQLLAGIKGNETAGGDKAYKKVVAGHGPQILGTLYVLNFETTLRAQALLKYFELKLPPEEFLDFLEELSQADDVKALAKMVIEKRTDYTAKSLVNPALAGDVATTGTAMPGRFAAMKDPTGALAMKRAELAAQVKKEKEWAKKEKAMRGQGLFTDAEIEAKKKEFLARDPAEETFDGNLEDTGDEETADDTPAGTVKAAATDAVAKGASKAITKGFSALLG